MKASLVSLFGALFVFAGATLLVAAPPVRPNPPGPAGGPNVPAGKVKHCGKEHAHPAHRWGGLLGRTYSCPGGRDPRPPGKADPTPRR